MKLFKSQFHPQLFRSYNRLNFWFKKSYLFQIFIKKSLIFTFSITYQYSLKPRFVNFNLIISANFSNISIILDIFKFCASIKVCSSSFFPNKIDIFWIYSSKIFKIGQYDHKNLKRFVLKCYKLIILTNKSMCCKNLRLVLYIKFKKIIKNPLFQIKKKKHD